MNFFDFLNSINENKKDLIREDPLNEKEYNSFMINICENITIPARKL